MTDSTFPRSYSLHVWLSAAITISSFLLLTIVGQTVHADVHSPSSKVASHQINNPRVGYPNWTRIQIRVNADSMLVYCGKSRIENVHEVLSGEPNKGLIRCGAVEFSTALRMHEMRN